MQRALSIRLADEERTEWKARAERLGFSTLSAYLKWLVRNDIRPVTTFTVGGGPVAIMSSAYNEPAKDEGVGK